jgi:hypothetical protein
VMLMSAAVAYLLRDGVPTTARLSLNSAGESLVEVRRRLRDLASAFVPVFLLIVVLNLCVVGAPVAAWLTVRYQFVGQVTMLEGAGGSRARHRSSSLVRHRWWHTAIFTLLVWSGIQLTGVLLGLILLITFTGLPLWTISLAVLVVQIALTPLGAISLTLLYGDAVAEGAIRSDELEPGTLSEPPVTRERR